MQIKELMRRHVRALSPATSVQEAVYTMDSLGVRVLPICTPFELVGMLSDRDIAIRATLLERSPKEVKVGEIMDTDMVCCLEDADSELIAREMEERRLSQLPVVDHEKKLVGMVSLQDLVL